MDNYTGITRFYISLDVYLEVDNGRLLVQKFQRDEETGKETIIPMHPNTLWSIIINKYEKAPAPTLIGAANRPANAGLERLLNSNDGRVENLLSETRKWLLSQNITLIPFNDAAQTILGDNEYTIHEFQLQDLAYHMETSLKHEFSVQLGVTLMKNYSPVLSSLTRAVYSDGYYNQLVGGDSLLKAASAQTPKEFIIAIMGEYRKDFAKYIFTHPDLLGFFQLHWTIEGLAQYMTKDEFFALLQESHVQDIPLDFQRITQSIIMEYLTVPQIKDMLRNTEGWLATQDTLFNGASNPRETLDNVFLAPDYKKSFRSKELIARITHHLHVDLGDSPASKMWAIDNKKRDGVNFQVAKNLKDLNTFANIMNNCSSGPSYIQNTYTGKAVIVLMHYDNSPYMAELHYPTSGKTLKCHEFKGLSNATPESSVEEHLTTQLKQVIHEQTPFSLEVPHPAPVEPQLIIPGLRDLLLL